MLKITFIAGRYWPCTGGVETLIRHVATELSQRHEVTVVADRIDECPDVRLGESLRHPPAFVPFLDGAVRVVPIDLGRRQRIALAPLVVQVTPGVRRYAYGRLRVCLAAVYAEVVSVQLGAHVRGASLVHAWTTGFLGAAAVRAARAARRPVVMTPFVHPGQWGDDLASQRALRSVDRVVGLLEAERSMFHELGVSPARVATCGVCAPQVLPGTGATLRARHRIDGPLVLFLGVRRPYKGHGLLIAAADRITAQIPDVTFAFVGPGPSLRLDGVVARVLDVGAVDDNERAGWLDAADLLCLPSQHEIFPVSILEAWSVRTPALVSDLPPLMELMQRSGGGRTVRRDTGALAACVVDLLQHPDRTRRLGDAGYEFWRAHHTPAAIAGCYERLYSEIMRESRCVGN